MKTLLLVTVFFLAACSKEPASLTFWVGGAPQEVDFWEQLVKEFEADSGLSVQVIRQPSSTDQRKQGLVLALDARHPDPDLFLMDIVWVGQFAQSQWLEPLDAYFDKDHLYPGLFFDRIVSQIDRNNGATVALPAFLDVGLLYYRTDLLKRHGFSAPPETWDALLHQAIQIQAAERRANPNFNGFVWQGAQYEGLVCTFLEFTTTFGGGFVNRGSLDMSRPANRSALQFMQDLIQRFKVSPPNTYTEMREEEVRQTFQRGNALFERNWLYAWHLHQEDGSAVKGKVGMAALPHVPGASTAAALGGWHFGISRYSDAKAQAWQLAAFLLSKAVQKRMLMRLGWYSCRKDVYQDPEVRQKIDNIDQLQQIVAHAVGRPNEPYYEQVSRIIQRYANDCLAGKIEPGAALNRMQKEIETVEARYAP